MNRRRRIAHFGNSHAPVKTYGKCTYCHKAIIFGQPHKDCIEAAQRELDKIIPTRGRRPS